jgi:hypothetical protein
MPLLELDDVQIVLESAVVNEAKACEKACSPPVDLLPLFQGQLRDQIADGRLQPCRQHCRTKWMFRC